MLYVINNLYKLQVDLKTTLGSRRTKALSNRVQPASKLDQHLELNSPPFITYLLSILLWH